MKHKMSKLLSVLLCCVMLLTLLPVTAAAEPDWTTGYSKSKTATNLDSNFESQVTLSLPSAEKQLETDVVFVLDKSTSSNVKDEALKMLKGLKTQVEGNNAKVKVGVVIFNKVANEVLDLTDLDTNYEAIEEAIQTEIKSGTNTHAGLLAGKKMLDDDASVDASRKYLIFVSDGNSYMYGAEPTVTAYYWMNDGSPYFSFDNYAWNFKYQNNNAAPESWTDWLSEIGDIINNETDENKAIEIEYNGDAAQNLLKYRTKGTEEFGKNIPTELATAADGLSAYATNVDRALYYSYQVYAAAQQKGYHCYAMTATTTSSSDWASSFMDFLAGSKTVSFNDIKNDILYLVGAGSYVEDYMGYVEGDYNFDFVNEVEALTMTVGGVPLTTQKIDDNSYVFGERDNQGVYPYELTYYPANGNEAAERFVWTMNVPVTNLAHVQLTYTVKLTNPKTAAGTYGQYDGDGSKDYLGLYTNYSAALYPKTTGSDGVGAAEEFPKPTVSYTVASSRPTTKPSTTKPSTTKPISSPKTFDAGIALYAGMALLSLTGGAWVVNKKRNGK